MYLINLSANIAFTKFVLRFGNNQFKSWLKWFGCNDMCNSSWTCWYQLANRNTATVTGFWYGSGNKQMTNFITPTPFGPSQPCWYYLIPGIKYRYLCKPRVMSTGVNMAYVLLRLTLLDRKFDIFKFPYIRFLRLWLSNHTFFGQILVIEVMVS